MAPVEMRFRTRDGVGLRALHWAGQPGGTPVILVHGLSSNCRLWDGAARELSAMGHDVIAVDLRGHGRSDKPDDGYDVAHVADDVMDVAASLGSGNPPWQRPLVIGQSWGGNIVVDIAARHGDRVRGVVAVDGGTIELRRAFPDFDECWRTMAPPALAGMRAERLRAFVTGAHRDWSEEAIDGTMANMEHRPDGTIAPWLTMDRHREIVRGLWDHSPSEQFSTITVPVLLTPAAKTEDEMTERKRRAHDNALSAITRCEVEWFVPADHDLHAQFPARFAQCVNDRIVRGFFA